MAQSQLLCLWLRSSKPLFNEVFCSFSLTLRARFCIIYRAEVTLNSMKTKHIGAFFVVTALAVSMFGFVVAQEGDESVPSRKIIVFKESLSVAEEAKIIAQAKGVRIKRMRTDNLSVVHLDASMEERLSKHPGVLRLEDDVVVEALQSQENSSVTTKAVRSLAPAQVTPWGINRIDAEQVWPMGERGAGIDVGVIDTGISTVHPDLLANLKGGISEVGYTASFNDDNGHGSHVAGIIGAVNNTAGVVGVAPSVNLWAIKVLDRRGSGYMSDVIDGIDWAVTHDMEVINMSLGCDCPSLSLHDAVIRAKNAGVVVVVAAGNSGGAVSYPAAYPEAIAVAATDISNVAPYWSSYGPEVDIAAPGVNIYSTYKGNKYYTMSGTSMAAPHVAGAAALALKVTPDTEINELSECVAMWDTDCDGLWSPTEIQNKLEQTAIDLGSAGQDDVYGFGLVNAYLAFTF